MEFSNIDVNYVAPFHGEANVTLENQKSLTGGGLVNANGTSTPFIGSPDHLSKPISTVDLQVVNWLITPPPFNEVSRDEIQLFMVEAFRNGIDMIQKVGVADPEIKSGDETLMESRWFYVKFDDSHKENIINKKSMEGAGQILERDGLYPLIMFLYLQKHYQEIYNTDNKLVRLCDEKGTLIEFDYRSIQSIQKTLDCFSIDAEKFRQYAEPLGLLPLVFDLAKMESDKTDMFF